MILAYLELGMLLFHEKFCSSLLTPTPLTPMTFNTTSVSSKLIFILTAECLILINLWTWLICLLDRCGETPSSRVSVYSFTGQLSSANYPDDYDNNIACHWRITVPSGMIGIYFSHFQTYYGSDYLQVT